MELNREKGATPLYLQLEDLIRMEIESGKYIKGDILPSEKEYMDKYDISRVTTRQALAALVQEGYIKRARGIGTVVSYEKISEAISNVISFTEEMKKHNITMETSYCKMELISPDTKTALSLGILKSDTCYKLSRVRDVEGKPLVYTVTYLKNLMELPLDPGYYKESLYKFLHDKYNISIVRGNDTLEAALPNDDVRNMLQISADMPIFIRTRKTFLPNDEIFEYSVCYYPGNRYKYSVDL
ncbi:GntR family transcriptional regulator [Butyrivibrio sp. WCD3002]|uniref:GntR family transcriptional regulator n=1 Tax=Butyrivibrio sp. WCD3002 TaxID=1280676 RepID=UPI00041DBF7F|nr:GntR family transcriptional regulator [Butyrivibrio sp. WCD3002]